VSAAMLPTGPKGHPAAGTRPVEMLGPCVVRRMEGCVELGEGVAGGEGKGMGGGGMQVMPPLTVDDVVLPVSTVCCRVSHAGRRGV
jgi:hypothetical protein